MEAMPWDEFMARWDWGQGEHCLALGPTGSGKTTLITQTLEKREYVVFICTKPKDKTADWLLANGYRKTATWPPKDLGNRWVLKPPIAKMTDQPAQAVTINNFLHQAYESGGWCIVVDELQYICDEKPFRALGVEDRYKTLLHQGRSLSITCVTGSQRPAWVPVVAYSSATHLFLFRTNDKRDLERTRDIAGMVDPKAIQERLLALPANKHWALYVNSRTGEMLEIVAPKIS